MVDPATIASFLPGLSKLLGGNTTKSTSTSNVASNITVGLQNVTGGTAAPQSSGSVTSTPSLVDATTPYTPPSYFPSTGVNNGLGAVSPSAGGATADTGFFGNPTLIVAAGAALFGIWYLMK